MIRKLMKQEESHSVIIIHYLDNWSKGAAVPKGSKTAMIKRRMLDRELNRGSGSQDESAIGKFQERDWGMENEMQYDYKRIRKYP